MLKDKRKEIPIDKKSKYHKFRGVDEKLKSLINSFGDGVIVYFDPDVDGMISGYFICKYITMIGKRFKWYVNTNREHDWTLNLNKIKGMDIIAVDFIITPEKVKEIVSSGCNLISIDHHVNAEYFIEYASDDDKYGVVINNQYPFEDKDGRYLSGAGVVFEALCRLDDRFNTVENRALVGLTLLSDVRDIENPYARSYLYDLYNHKYTGYIKYLIQHTLGERDYGFGVPRLDRNYVDFKFSPAINSCLRFNEEQQVVEFFLGSGLLDLSLHQAQKELVSEIQGVVKIRDFPHLRVCYFYEHDISHSNEVLSSFVGLVASRYLDGVHSVICYMISIDDTGKSYVKRASFRGNINGLDYRSSMQRYMTCVGHPPAFGIKGLNPSKSLFTELDMMCKEVEEGTSYKKSITRIPNLSMFVNREGREYGTFNMYCLSQHRKYIKYTGRNIQRKRSGANYMEYSVDGVSVMCFNPSVDFEKGIILPIIERDSLCMYLEEDSSIL